MDTNPDDMNSKDMKIDDMNSLNPDSNAKSGDTSSSEKSSNLAITIVVVAGILFGAVLVTNARSTGNVPSATPTIMATSDRLTSVPVTNPAGLPATVPPTPPPTNHPIQGIAWRLISVTDQSTSQTTTVSNPQQYTIIFSADGYVNGIADCNSYTGTYSQANRLTINITTMTMAACPEGSLEQQYLQLLGNVAAGGSDSSANLALETAGGAQRMLFQNGGPAR